MTNLKLQPRPRILLVDDETDVRTMLGLMLADEGYEVSHAANGNDAVRLHRDHPFKLIITELILKEKDGFKTFAELRRHSGTTRLIATAKSSWLPPELFRQMARQLGAHAALSKPFKQEEMLDAVRKALE